MPLFSDGNASDIADLRAYDAAVAEIAAAEGVELRAKLDVAMREIGVELEEFLQRCEGGRALLSQVVITPALKQWHVLRTLSLVYGDIHNSHVNRRFEQKWADYRTRAKWAAETLFRVGIGLVATPIPKAAIPEIRALPGTLSPGTYFVKVAWVGAGGETGAPSDLAPCSLASPASLGVRAIDPPEVAVGYHVYLGTAAGQLSRQTENSISVGLEWVAQGALRIGGGIPDGQQPHRYVRNDRILQRG